MNYKKMSYISGVVIFFSILILLLTIFGLSGNRIFFTRDYIVYVEFSDVIGLQDQAKVFMRGYRIGWTKNIQFEQDRVVVRVDINKKYRIPLDSKLEINTITMLGEKAITIHPGISDKFIKPNSMVKGQNKDIMIEMKNILNMVKENIEQGELNVRVKQLSESIQTFHTLLGKIDKKIDKVDIEDYNRQVKNIGEAGRMAKIVLAKSSDSLQVSMKKINKAMEEFALLSGQLKQIAVKINNGQGSAGELINNKEYVKNLNKTIKEINALVADLKKNPKKYINISVF